MRPIIQPIFQKHTFFDSTIHRAGMLVTPIQKTSHKESDFLAYALTPFIDSALEAAFALDAMIHLLNATAAFYNVLYEWTMNQSQTPDMVDDDSYQAFEEGMCHLTQAASAIVAQTLNTILSILAWITRPFASVDEVLANDNDKDAMSYRGSF